MVISAKEAGELVGLSKAGVIKAIKTGRISGQKNIDGEWQVDTSELLRVYEPLPMVNTNGHSEVSASTPPVHTPEAESLQVEFGLLRQLLTVREDEIDDLRRRLDRASDEQERLGARLLALTAAPAPQPQRNGWWARLFGGAGVDHGHTSSGVHADWGKPRSCNRTDRSVPRYLHRTYG